MLVLFCFFFFKQKTAYEMRISDWSSDVCSSDLPHPHRNRGALVMIEILAGHLDFGEGAVQLRRVAAHDLGDLEAVDEHALAARHRGQSYLQMRDRKSVV